MPTVAELSAPYGNFMLGPRPGPDVCGVCFNLTDGYGRCYACAHGGRWLDAVAPISYSVGGEQLHHALAAYKRGCWTVTRRLEVELAAVLWRHLAEHETCIARAAGAEHFELVAAVPSSERAQNQPHPLQRLVGELVGPTRERYRPLLRRTEIVVEAHEFSARKFAACDKIADRSVLLIDDTWTTGANAQSAAATLKAAGAGRVGAVVMGRYLNRGWHHNDRRLRGLRSPFDWHRCAHCPDPQDVG